MTCAANSSASKPSRRRRAIRDRSVVCASISRRSRATCRIVPRSDISSRLRDAEVWLAPISGTRVLVPYRFSLPTPVGIGVLQATAFVSVPKPPRAMRPPRKTQCSRRHRWMLALAPHAPLSTGAWLLTHRQKFIGGPLILSRRKIARSPSAEHPIVVLRHRAHAICRSERSRTRHESPIRPRFVRDSFHTLSTGLSRRHVVIQERPRPFPQLGGE